MSMFRRGQDSYSGPPVLSATRQPALTPPGPAPKAAPTSSADLPADSTEVAEPQTAAPPVSREAAAVIDERSEITGTLHSQGNVLIEGRFKGEIEARETVWVEKSAQTSAQLHANDVIISGSFDGEIACRHRLQIVATASIRGEIKTPVLVIEEGATVNCRFSMTRSGGLPK